MHSRLLNGYASRFSYYLLTLLVPWVSAKTRAARELIQIFFHHPKEKRKKAIWPRETTRVLHNTCNMFGGSAEKSCRWL